MHHARHPTVFMALMLFCIGVPAQSVQPSGLMSATALSTINFDSARQPLFSSSASEAETSPATQDSPSPQKAKKTDKLHVRPFSTFAIGVKVDTLGAGVEVATPLSRTLNLRATANLVKFTYNFNIDGIAYSTQLDFHSGHANIDWFPFHGGFHISPGILYFQNSLSGTAAVPAGQPFQLSNTSYINSVDDPVSGTVAIAYPRKIAPTLTIGFGNIIPRTGKHFSMPFEIGVAYLGAAQMKIQLMGTACTNNGCFNAATDSGTQASLLQEEQTLNNDLAVVKFYPIISTGLAFRF